MRPLAALLVAVVVVGCNADDDPSTGDRGESTIESPAADSTPSDPATSDPATSDPATSDPATALTAAPASTAPDSTATTTTTVQRSIDGRPFDVFVPTAYDGATAVPLVVLLHGYTSSSALQHGYFGMQAIAEDRGFLAVHPDGTIDARGNQFWNATDACCNLTGSAVDDSAYLNALVEDVQATFAVDPKRIYFVGHSNGGFMSYRMACEHADKVAAIASLAGATFADVDRCRPSEPVNVLQIHGTADSVIGYEGGDIMGNAFPSAATTVATWASYNGCSPTLQPDETRLDLEANLPDTDTAVEGFADCPVGGDVELWTIEDGAHSPLLSATFTEHVVDFLLAHPKP